jgi:hypothetical protein
MSYGNINPSLVSGAIIAMSPYNAPPESVVTFDGLEIKWHNSAAGSFDGIAIRSQSGVRSLRYTSVEFYLANAAADGGKALYGSNNAWYNIPNLGAVATIINAVYPYAQNVSTTFLGFGNPAMPNADYRQYVLYDDTNQATYLITIDKQASTGEVLAAQNGTCLIVVERIGITSNQAITASAPLNLASGAVSFTAPYIRAFGSIALSDLSTANVIVAESTPGITASVISGAGTAVMVMQVNLPAGLLLDPIYKIGSSISSNPAEAAGANASVVDEIAGKTATSFRVIFREVVGALQNCNYEFFIIK